MSLTKCINRRVAAAAAVALTLVAVESARAEAPALLARAVGAEPAAFDVYFPPQHQAALDALLAAQTNPASPRYHKFLEPREFREQFGPSAQTVATVTAQLRAAGFSVASRSALGLRVTGSVGAVEAAFATRLSHGRFADGHQRLVAERPLALSGVLASTGAHVVQFTTAPANHKDSQVIGKLPPNFISSVGAYYTADLRQAYDYPSVLSLNGKGVTIGVLMAGDFQQSDMDLYWSSERLFDTSLQPKITSVPVNGGLPYSASNSDETELDIQQSAGMAPGAAVILYNMSDLDASTVIYGLTLINEANKVDVVNMSFGGPEVDYLAKNNNGVDLTWLLQIQHALFQQGNAQGITFVASSGDHGAIPRADNCVGSSCVTKPTLTAQNPADDPAVTVVGGTNLVTSHDSTNNSFYRSENANPDSLSGTNAGIWGSGGGISVIFAKPSYQTLVATPSATFRSEPDLALHMGGCQAGFAGFPSPCPASRSSDILALDGSRTVVIGTSAAAPDITGLFALMVKHAKSGANPSGRQGNMNTYIYTQAKTNAAKAFHHAGIVGSNGHYTVKPPYDAVLGNGTVDARQFMRVTNLPTSDQLGEPSNP